ncbi:MFS transporter [Vibrio navarrensis]|uniref:MFS transporter n=1 Tax=Vibrio navarrensis TaxID=29495 RepID=UPI002094A630|nr:MFS transporter [Vibrio navarrensis]
MSAWAPLIPFAKLRLGIDDGLLGLMLFCIGAGSMLIMPVTSQLLTKFGCRKILVSAGILLCLDLPLLTLIDEPVLMSAALLLFGVVNGIMDVAMNSQAIVVERESGQAKMSGFHGFYSLGSIAGAGCVSVLLWSGMPPQFATSLIACILMLLLLISARDLLPAVEVNNQHKRGVLSALTQSKVAFIALLCFFVFLTEGAMLDWSALFLHTELGVAKSQAGLGFTLYAVAVTIARLYGDRLVNAIGRYRVLLLGSLLAILGLALMIATDLTWLTFLGLGLVGLGIANIVPILFNAAGNQAQVPANLAFPAVTLIGYVGLLVGPAFIGFIAHSINLTVALGSTIFCLLLVMLSARKITR